MELRDHYGLALAVIEPAELDRRPWAQVRERIDVVRLPEPPAGLAGELATRGFVVKPSAVTWLAELGADEAAFLGLLERADRQSIRRAQRRAAAAGLREVVADPVTPELLDRFLVLYAARVARMRFGVPFALDYRDTVLNGPDKFFGVFAVAGDGVGGGGADGTDVVGGVLVLERPDIRTAVLRFSAVSAGWRRRSLPRALYTAALRIAREKGYEFATLGDEPNLSGHLTKPGLFVFKAGLGFRPVPAQDFTDPAGTDEADLVLRLGALSDPTLILGYPASAPGGEHTGAGGAGGTGGGSSPPAAAGGPRQLAVNLVCESPVNTALYAAPSLAPTVLRRPGG